MSPVMAKLSTPVIRWWCLSVSQHSGGFRAERGLMNYGIGVEREGKEGGGGKEKRGVC